MNKRLYKVVARDGTSNILVNRVHFCYESLTVIPMLLSVTKIASFFAESTGAWIQNHTRASTGSWTRPNGEYRFALFVLLVLCVCTSWISMMSVFVVRVFMLSGCTGNLRIIHCPFSVCQRRFFRTNINCLQPEINAV
jgi:hypothetical protein